MPAEGASLSASATLPIAQAYSPTTFQERGAAVPFTSPALLGARIRPADRAGWEIVVPNPSGGRGVYILPWAGVCQLCRPTVHDTLLSQRLAALDAITPASVRIAARTIAAEGMAGRDAVAAAHAAGAAEQLDRLVANFHLLLALVAQVDPAELADLPADCPPSVELELLAGRAVARLEPKLGRSAGSVADCLEQLAHAFAGVGAPTQNPPPRIPRLLAALGRLRADMLVWSRDAGGDSAAWAGMIGAVAEVTIACAERIVADAQATTQDMAALLRGWSAGSALATRIARPEWLLDGWEQICLVWHCAEAGDDDAKRAALVEMGRLVPALPRETSDWVGMAVDTAAAARFSVRVIEDWHPGMTLERVARNETLRALAV